MRSLFGDSKTNERKLCAYCTNQYNHAWTNILAEQITEQTIISEIEIEYKLLIGIFIITCIIEIGFAVIDEKALLEDVDITEDMKYLCRKL